MVRSGRYPAHRRKLWLGHGATSVTDLYERHHVDAFLAEDAELLRQFIGEPPSVGLRVMK